MASSLWLPPRLYPRPLAPATTLPLTPLLPTVHTPATPTLPTAPTATAQPHSVAVAPTRRPSLAHHKVGSGPPPCPLPDPSLARLATPKVHPHRGPSPFYGHTFRWACGSSSAPSWVWRYAYLPAQLPRPTGPVTPSSDSALSDHLIFCTETGVGGAGRGYAQSVCPCADVYRKFRPTPG